MIDIVWEHIRMNDDIMDMAYELEIPTEIASCYYSRNMKTIESVKDFLNVDINRLHDPYLLPDMQKAVDRICDAINNRDLIHIHGDYDVDGVTATAIMAYALTKMKANFTYYTPHRIDDGYDLKSKHVEAAVKEGVDLLITVDCGIRATDALAKAQELGLDVIITDHHIPPDTGIPPAFAVVSPHRKDSKYPFKDLAGCGLAFKLILAVGKRQGLSEAMMFDHLIDYVTLGTVADMSPLVDENRILVSFGCDKLLNTSKVGLKELLKIANVKQDIDTTTIGFYLGPRINAIGRLADSMTALELMLETNKDRAILLAKQLDTANSRRQQMQEQSFKEAAALMPEDMSNTYVITTAAKSWHPGIVGLVASKLTEAYGLPSLVGVINGDVIRGSCRSTYDFPIIDALRAHHDLFIKYGGHAYAAGFEITTDNFKKLIKGMNEYAKNYFGEDRKPLRIIKIESVLQPQDINQNLYTNLTKIAPFGTDNPEPIFCVRGVNIFGITIFGNQSQYAKFKFKKDDENRWVSATWWRKNDERCVLQEGMIVDIAFKIKAEVWQGTKVYIAIVEDIKESS